MNFKADKARTMVNAVQGTNFHELPVNAINQRIRSAILNGHDHITMPFDEDDFSTLKEAGYHTARTGPSLMIVSW